MGESSEVESPENADNLENLADDSENLRKVNWVQACVEALLLLAGVLLALMGQAWWEDREERKTISEYAANLRVEVTANQEELQKAIRNHGSLAIFRTFVHRVPLWITW